MKKIAFTFMLILIGMVSCKENGGVSNASGNDFFKDAENLKKIQTDLLSLPKYKDKKVNVFQNIMFNTQFGLIDIDIQDPSKPENVDHYQYKDGKWSEPAPVQISGNGNMSENTTPMDKIDFAVVAKIARTWEEKYKTVEGANNKLGYIQFVYAVNFNKRYWNSSDIESGRGKYGLEFNIDGSLSSFAKK